MMHGSSGVGANIEPWVHQFNQMGISTFVIDSMTGRGLTSVSANQAQLGQLNFIVDIYRHSISSPNIRASTANASC